MNSRNLVALLIILANIVLVVFLYDEAHVMLFSLVVPFVFWFVSITEYITQSEYFDPLVLNATSLVSVLAVGLYAYTLEASTLRYWFMGWYLAFVGVFVELVFKFRYKAGNEYLFFVSQSFLFLMAVYLISYTPYVPWGILWIVLLPIILFLLMVFSETFVQLTSRNHVVLKSIIGVLAIVCIGYIALFARPDDGFECLLDTACPHGSARRGTGQLVRGNCRCINSHWFKSSSFGICLPCSMALGSEVDCCGTPLTQQNIETLRCGTVTEKFSFSCVS